MVYIKEEIKKIFEKYSKYNEYTGQRSHYEGNCLVCRFNRPISATKDAVFEYAGLNRQEIKAYKYFIQKGIFENIKDEVIKMLEENGCTNIVYDIILEKYSDYGAYEGGFLSYGITFIFSYMSKKSHEIDMARIHFYVDEESYQKMLENGSDAKVIKLEI